jgi:Ca2+-binding RTX toxin-like protein
MPTAPVDLVLHAWDEASLASAIRAANQANTSVTLHIGTAHAGGDAQGPARIELTQDLPTLLRSVTIEGNGSTIDGNDAFRGFMVLAEFGVPVEVSISGLTFAHTVARGGDGGDTADNGGRGSMAGPGGGGAGLGGGLFVGDGATVIIRDVHFENTAAIGGDGGSGYSDRLVIETGTAGGGGGGLGGDGGASLNDHGPGGGGIGQGATGGSDPTRNGGIGIVPGLGYAASGSNSVSYRHYAVYTETIVTYGGEGGNDGGGGGVGAGGGGGGGGLYAPYPGDKNGGDEGFQFDWSVKGLMKDLVAAALTVSMGPGGGLVMAGINAAIASALIEALDAALEQGGVDLDSLPSYQIGNRAGSDEEGTGIPGAGALISKPFSMIAGKLLSREVPLPVGIGGTMLWGNTGPNVPGGPGGYGGGGGGGGSDSMGGRGGFGGGGGGSGSDYNLDIDGRIRSDAFGGMGGFGGGAGGRYALDLDYGNNPGFGGGLAQFFRDGLGWYRLGGGGGLGAGGAIFIQDGGNLIDLGSTVTDAEARGGAGGTAAHQEYSSIAGQNVAVTGAGLGLGSSVFLQGMARLTVSGDHGPVTIGNISDAAGVQDRFGGYSNDITINGVAVNRGAVDIVGSGRVILTGQNTYLGGTWLGADLLRAPDGVTDENSSNYNRFPQGGATLEITRGTSLYGGIYVYGDSFVGGGSPHSTLVIDNGVTLDRSIVIVNQPGIDRFHTGLVDGLEAMLNLAPLTIDLTQGGLFTGRILGLLPGQGVTFLGAGLDNPNTQPHIDGDTLTVYTQAYTFPGNVYDLAHAVVTTQQIAETTATRRFWAGTGATLQLTLDFLDTHPLTTPSDAQRFYFDGSLGEERAQILLDAQAGSTIALGNIVVPDLDIPIILANTGGFQSGTDPWVNHLLPGAHPHALVQLLGGSITLNAGTQLTLFGGDPRSFITTLPEASLEVTSPILDGGGPSALHTLGGVRLSGVNGFSGGILFNGLLELDRPEAAGSGALTFEHVNRTPTLMSGAPVLTRDGGSIPYRQYVVDRATLTDTTTYRLADISDARVTATTTATIRSDGSGNLVVGGVTLRFNGDRDGGWEFVLSSDGQGGTFVRIPNADQTPAIMYLARGQTVPAGLQINGTDLPDNLIRDFGSDGLIHLRDIADSRLDGSTPVAVLSDGAGNLSVGGQVLHLNGDVGGGTRFLLTSDGAGGTLIRTSVINNVFAGGNGAWEFDWTVRYLNILSGFTTPISGEDLRDALRPAEADIRLALRGDAVMGGPVRGIFSTDQFGFEADPAIHASAGHDFILDGEGHALSWRGSAPLTLASGRAYLENLTLSGALRVMNGARLVIDNSDIQLAGLTIEGGGRVEIHSGALGGVLQTGSGQYANGSFPDAASVLMATPAAGQVVTVGGAVQDTAHGVPGTLAIGGPDALADSAVPLAGGRVVVAADLGRAVVFNNSTVEFTSALSRSTVVELRSSVGSVVQLDGPGYALGGVVFGHELGEIDLTGMPVASPSVLTVDQQGVLRVPGVAIGSPGAGGMRVSGAYGAGAEFLLTGDGEGGARLIPLLQSTSIASQRELDGLIPYLNDLPGLQGLRFSLDLGQTIAIDHTGPLLATPGLALDLRDGTPEGAGFAVAAGVSFRLDGTNSFSGGITLADGSTLELANAHAGGSGDITFDGASIALMLARDGFTGAIRGLLPSDYIDLGGFLTTATSRVAVDATGHLTLADAMGSVTLFLPDLANRALVRMSDGEGGTILARPVDIALANDTGAFTQDGITSDPTLEGQGFPDAALLVSIDGATPFVILADGDGHWTSRPSLEDGRHTVSIIQADMVGNAGRVSLTFTLDTTAPAPPAITGIQPDTGDSATDGITRSGAVTILGAGSALGQRVTVREGETVLGTTTALADGSWSLALATPLGEGTHQLTAAQADAAYNLSAASSAFAVTVDLTAPTVTAALRNDTGASATDSLTSSRTLVGTAEAGRLVTVRNGAAVVGSATADSEGRWSLSHALADGTYRLVASETDVAGNTGRGVVAFTLDTTAPGLTIGLVTAPTGDLAPSAAVTGTTDPNAVVTLREGATVLGTVTANGAGSWSLSPFLVNGAHTLTATATDAAGNATTASTTFTLRVPPPAVTAALAHDTGASATDRITADAALTGLGDPDALVTIRNGDAVLGTTTAGADGRWSFTPTLADGTYTLTASETNAAGTTGTASLAFTLNTNIVTAIATAAHDGPFGIGETIRFTLTTSVADQVFGGTPRLLLSNGASATYNAAASGGTQLAFDLTVAAGQDTSGLRVVGLALGGEIGVPGSGTVHVLDRVIPVTTPDGLASGIGGAEIGHLRGTLGRSVYLDLHPANTGLQSYAVLQATGDGQVSGGGAYSVATYSYLGVFHRPGSGDDGFIVYRLPGLSNGPTGIGLLEGDAIPYGTPTGALATTGGTGTPRSAAAIAQAPGGVPNGLVTLAVANGDGSLSLLFENAQHGFSAPITLSTAGMGMQVSTVATAVLTAGGGTSLVLSRFGGPVGIMLPTDATPTLYTPAASASDVTTADVNGDGLADLIVADFGGGSVKVLLNDGTGHFGAAASYAAGSSPFGVAAGDLDGDGKADLVVGNLGGGVTVLMNDGTGGFGAGVHDDAGGGVGGVAILSIFPGETDILAPRTNGGVALLRPAPRLTSALDLLSVPTAAGHDTGVVIDTTPPDAPRITAFESDSGTIGDGITTDHTLLLRGTAEAGATVTLLRDGGAFGSARADGTGAWSFDGGAVVLDNGSYAFTALATDAAGNASALSAALRVTVAGTGMAVAAASAAKAEGASGGTAFTFTVTRIGDLAQAQSVGWSVAGEGSDPAIADDFAGAAFPGGVVDFQPGEASRTLTVQVAGDRSGEFDEGFVVTLASPTGGASIAIGTARGTILNDDVFPMLRGTAGDDLLAGGADAETLLGLEGADTLAGGGGNDTMNAAAGDDWLDGEAGADTMVGGAGNDTYTIDTLRDVVVEDAAGGIDLLRTPFATTLPAWIENLQLLGTVGLKPNGNALANAMTGGRGNDLLSGLDGADTLAGGGGADTLRGGAGGDVLIVDSTTDLVTEVAGGGADTVLSSISLLLPGNVEDLVLTGGDSIAGTGNSLANRILGNAAANALNGGLGADTLAGGGGDDTYRVDARDVVVELADGGRDIVSATGTFSLQAMPFVEVLQLGGAETANGTGNAGDNLITGNAQANRLDGLDGNDTLSGGAGADTLRGGGGADSLNGGSGADRLEGGAGNDAYLVTDAQASVVELAASGADTIASTVSFVLPANVEVLSLIGSAAIDGTGNAAANLLLGNGVANRLEGGGGADSIAGGNGADTLVGQAMADTLAGGAGNDIFLYASAAEGGDLLTDYASRFDQLMVSATGFGGGLVEEMSLATPSRFLTLASGPPVATAAAGTGQFIYQADALTLWWDPDGMGADAPQAVLSFSAAVAGFNGAEISVIA